MNLENKNIIVTGGASGLGAATVRHLTSLGANVIIADIEVEKASLLVAEGKGKVSAYAVDVTDSDSAEKIMAIVVKQHAALHGLVNCAGIAPAERAVGKNGPMPLSHFQRVINVNLVGSFNMLRLVAAQIMAQEPLEKDGERGVIINVASAAAFEGQIGQAAYSASKGGIAAMTLPLAREFARFGIRVMTIAPGVFASPMVTSMPDKVQQSLAASIPFPARLGDGEEFAQLVQHIFANTYLNGGVIRLDGAVRLT